MKQKVELFIVVLISLFLATFIQDFLFWIGVMHHEY